MLDSANDSPPHPPRKERLAVSDECSIEAVVILEELLAQSILLRDLYKIARWQTCNGELCRMHQLFEDHYKDQLHIVDVLIDRVRMLGGTQRVFAGAFLKGTEVSRGIRAHRTPGRWVDELLDTHELVLSTTQPARATDNHLWVHEFAVGLVVLTNDLQSASLREQWLRQTHDKCVRTLPHKEKWI